MRKVYDAVLKDRQLKVCSIDERVGVPKNGVQHILNEILGER